MKKHKDTFGVIVICLFVAAIIFSCLADPKSEKYTVQGGDSHWKIARDHCMVWSEYEEMNYGSISDILQPGTEVWVKNRCR